MSFINKGSTIIRRSNKELFKFTIDNDIRLITMIQIIIYYLVML